MKRVVEHIVVVGTSSGGLSAFCKLLNGLGDKFSYPVILVQHRGKDDSLLLEEILQSKTSLKVKGVETNEIIYPGTIYVAPPDYHLLVENNGMLSLCVDEKVMFSRPSIDVLFESAAYSYKDRVIAVLLTGANSDGAKGLKKVKELGGITIAQDPQTAEHPIMPESAVRLGAADHILPIEKIAKFLLQL